MQDYIFRVVEMYDGKYSVKTNQEPLNALILTSTCHVVYDTERQAYDDAMLCCFIRELIDKIFDETISKYKNIMNSLDKNDYNRNYLNRDIQAILQTKRILSKEA